MFVKSIQINSQTTMVTCVRIAYLSLSLFNKSTTKSQSPPNKGFQNTKEGGEGGMKLAKKGAQRKQSPFFT